MIYKVKSYNWTSNVECCIFGPAFGCCAPQTPVEIVIFSVFCAEKLKKLACLKRRHVFEASGPHSQTAKINFDLCRRHNVYDGGQNYWCKLKKNCFFCLILNQISAFFSFAEQKKLKMTIWTSIWGVQHPNAGRNIQHFEVNCLPNVCK